MTPLKIMHEILLELENMTDKRPFFADTERLLQWEQAIMDYFDEVEDTARGLIGTQREEYLDRTKKTMKKFNARFERELLRPNLTN